MKTVQSNVISAIVCLSGGGGGGGGGVCCGKVSAHKSLVDKTPVVQAATEVLLRPPVQSSPVQFSV